MFVGVKLSTVKCEALLAFFVVSELTKSFYEVLKMFWERFVESVLQKSRISTENKDQKRTDQLNDFRKSENDPVTSLNHENLSHIWALKRRILKGLGLRLVPGLRGSTLFRIITRALLPNNRTSELKSAPRNQGKYEPGQGEKNVFVCPSFCSKIVILIVTTTLISDLTWFHMNFRTFYKTNIYI